ncbi:transporter [Tenacibaculum sp. 1B UA]|uniref:transporter n=1 Tax=Tenacibaculum sp. 1B UA TaxID=2922252 RepID=UPI002A246025|nr:transporter [Tenacibaculum sp. 1B UA]
MEAFTGISKNNRINVGAIVEFRSNTIGGRQALSVFSLKDNPNIERKGITSIAPAIKFQPLKNVGNFSVQSAIHIPLVSNETEKDVFLDQTAWTFQNRFFYDYTFSSGKWQLFTELNTEYNFGDEDSFANNTFLLAPGIFFSYFPNEKSTVLAFTQHSQRFGDFTQDYTALGLGGKYQLTSVLNLEVLYSNFVRGNNNGLGQSFNVG